MHAMLSVDDPARPAPAGASLVVVMVNPRSGSFPVRECAQVAIFHCVLRGDDSAVGNGYGIKPLSDLWCFGSAVSQLVWIGLQIEELFATAIG